ncbi:MAG: OsmC family protein [Flavobacteriales bacterium]|nr:OsmC family protein [Flavobacteriales bacterium]
MKHEVETMWMDGMRFNALVQGHTVVMDAPERVGGNDEGPIPKPLVLTALSGCTGMDVIALLRKDGRKLRSFAMRVSGELSKGAPMVYVATHLTFEAEGAPEDEQALIGAVQRSQNELCGVAAMLRCSMPVTWELRFNGVLVAQGDGPSVP